MFLVDIRAYLRYDIALMSESANYDTTTAAGRKALDAAVAKKLSALPLSRSDVAKRLGMDGDANSLRAVAVALKRGVRDGWARVENGSSAWAKYARMR